MEKEIIKQALTIAGTRLVALTMATADIMVLARYSKNQIADLTLCSQYIQVFVVLTVVLNIGVNIFINSGNEIKSKIKNISCFSAISGGFLTVICLIFGQTIHLSTTQQAVYFALALGILPCSFYIGFCNILESQNKASLVFKATILFAIINILLDIFFIHMDFSTEVVAVSLSTTMVRFTSMAVGFFLVNKYMDIYPLPAWNWNAIKSLFSFSKTEALTSLFFTGGLSILCAHVSSITTPLEFAKFGIGLNFLNCTSILYVGFSISATIFASKNHEIINRISLKIVKLSIIYISTWSVILFLLRYPISWLYIGNFDQTLINIFLIGIGVVAFDGIAMSAISLLRVTGRKTFPPMFRLSLVLIGIPLSVFLFKGNNISIVFFCLMVGNMIAAALSVVYFFL